METTSTPTRKRRRRRSEEKNLSGRIQDIFEGVLEEEEKVRAEVMADHWRRHASQGQSRCLLVPRNYLGGETLPSPRPRCSCDVQPRTKESAREIDRVCNNLRTITAGIHRSRSGFFDWNGAYAASARV